MTVPADEDPVVELGLGGSLRIGRTRIAVADTVGVADPKLVFETLAGLREKLPDVAFGLHLHDTRGMALANVLAALQAGVTEFDSAVGGLGGRRAGAGVVGEGEGDGGGSLCRSHLILSEERREA